MRLSSKITALCLALAMLVGTSVTGFALTFSDVTENTKYNGAISSMVSLGLLKGYEDGTFRPEATMTRAEFAAVMTRAIGMEKMVEASSSAAIFTDMTTNGVDHWATGYVKIAYDKGIILGMGDGTFEPDAPVTYEQAVKMIVCALGREVAAKEKGGWPNGYIAEANDINLTQGANMSPTNDPAPRGIVAQLVFNSLEIKLMERSTGGKLVQTSKTMLNDMLKVTSFTNMILTEVDGTVSINAGTSNINDGELVLESGLDVATYIYKDILTSDKAKDYLGHYVSGYYKKDSDDEEKRILLSIESASSKNQEVTILSDNIDLISNLTIQYWEDKENDTRTEEIKISPTAKLIYNGVAYNYLASNIAEEKNLTYWLNPNSSGFLNGEIRLLDSGSDGTYDLIFIDDYQTFVVKSPVKTNDPTYANNYCIFDYYTTGKSIQIDPYDRNNTVNIYNAKTNAVMSIENIRSMNILSVASSYDHKSFKCYVSTDAMSGTVSAKRADGMRYNINNKEYDVTKEFALVVSAGKVSMDVGSTGTFYLDKDGKIAAATITAAQTGNYTYITAAGKYDISGENAAIEIISLNGTPSTPTKYKIANKVNINNKTYTDPDEIVDAIQAAASLLRSNVGAGDAKYSQLAKVAINSSKEVTSITTAATTTSGSGAVSLDIGTNLNNGTLKMGQESKEYLYSSGSGFESQIFANASTQILIVPTSRRETTKYRRTTGSSYFTAGNRYTIEAYDVDGSSNAKVIVVYGDEADIEITNNTPACVINSIMEILSGVDGSRVFAVEVYENGMLKTYETEDTSNEYSLNIGDVARFGFNGKGQINKIDLQVDSTNPIPRKLHGDSVNENGEYQFKSIFGTVSSLTTDRIVISPAFVDKTGETPVLAQDDREGYTMTSDVKIYRVRANQTPATVEQNIDINTVTEFGDTAVNENASKVYAFALSGVLKMIVIYAE